ncbi:double-CXXCG motif protein [Corallococcus exercitus]|uniref:SitI6 family double-CXXCG motif immunity protein n=1 Tax=Corallococcus exercitus TaxID=2316736 RepID=UPI0035D4348F
MRFYQLQRPASSAPRHWNGSLSAEHLWSLPGVECPTCHETWSGQFTLPSVDLSSLSEHELLQEPRVEPYAEYTRLASHVQPFLPSGLSPEPGMQFGPLRGTSCGSWGPVSARVGWEVLVTQEALRHLRAVGLRGLVPVRAELQGLNAGVVLYELELPVRGLLHRDAVMTGPQCPTCGWYEVRISPEPWLDGDALPHDVDLFRPTNGTTYTFVTERFVEAIQALGPSDVTLREVRVAPVSPLGSVH